MYLKVRKQNLSKLQWAISLVTYLKNNLKNNLQ